MKLSCISISSVEVTAPTSGPSLDAIVNPTAAPISTADDFHDTMIAGEMFSQLSTNILIVFRKPF